MSSLALYQSLIPAHSAVDSAVVSAYLDIAVEQHTSSAWGAVYAQAMVWFTAHLIETTPGTGAGANVAGQVGAITQQRDGDLSRSYASAARGDADDWLRATVYGQNYLRLRHSRAARGPWVAR